MFDESGHFIAVPTMLGVKVRVIVQCAARCGLMYARVWACVCVCVCVWCTRECSCARVNQRSYALVVCVCAVYVLCSVQYVHALRVLLYWGD